MKKRYYDKAATFSHGAARFYETFPEVKAFTEKVKSRAIRGNNFDSTGLLKLLDAHSLIAILSR